MPHTKLIARSLLLPLLFAIAPGCTDATNNSGMTPTPREVVPLPASLSTAQTLVNEWIAADTNVSWNWIDMVLTYGFWKLYEAGGDPQILDYIATYVDENENFYRPIASDWLSPAVLDLLVCRETGNQDNCDRLGRYDDYFTEIVRREQGAVVHWTVVEQQQRQLWVDSIFMAGAYMIERALMLEGEAADVWWDDVTAQFLVFDEYLTDADTSLMHHGYDFAVTDPIMNGPGAFWGRGNGWYVAALGYVLQVLPPDHPDYAALADIWRARVETLLPLQDENGFWHTILDQLEHDYPEASGTALIAYGMAAGLNAGLTAPGAQAAVEAAVEGLNASIVEADGRTLLPQISESTVPGTVAQYLAVGTESNIAYGIGAYVMLAVEAARLNGEVEVATWQN